MEERRGVETGAATESWTVEHGAGSLDRMLGRDGVNNVRSYCWLAASMSASMSSSASSVSSQKAFISTSDCTKLEILLLRTLVTKHTLSNVYAQSKPVIRLVQCVVRTV